MFDFEVGVYACLVGFCFCLFWCLGFVVCVTLWCLPLRFVFGWLGLFMFGLTWLVWFCRRLILWVWYVAGVCRFSCFACGFVILVLICLVWYFCY